jgi:hypothetical protein
MFKGNKKEYSLCPAGAQQLVCVDVVDLGMQETQFGEKAKVRIVWQTAALDPKNGKPYRISGQYTNSLNEKATLRKTLESWLGRKLTLDEIENGFNPDTLLIGLNAFASIVHSAPNPQGGVFANIGSIMPIPPAMAKISAIEYDRVKDRKPKDGDEPPF